MRTLLLFLCLWTSLPLLAAEEILPFADARQQALFRELTHELRCPKCQNAACDVGAIQPVMRKRSHWVFPATWTMLKSRRSERRFTHGSHIKHPAALPAQRDRPGECELHKAIMRMLTIDKRHTATRFTGLEQQRIATPTVHPRIRRDHEPQALRAACRAGARGD